MILGMDRLKCKHAWVAGGKVYAYNEVVEFGDGGIDGTIWFLACWSDAYHDGGVLGEEGLAEGETVFVGFVHGDEMGYVGCC